MDLKDYVASIPGFPKEGIIFRDVTPMLQDADAFKESIKQMADYAKDKNIDVVVGPEARGFLFGCPVAIEIGAGFVPVRKPGKLPRETVSKSYDLEYGSNTIEMHKDAIKKGQRVLIVDDLLATGGTVEAAIDLIEEMGGVVAGIAFVIELKDLKAADALRAKGYDVFTLLKY
jgi:adenine phosphoribosyltransferase